MDAISRQYASTAGALGTLPPGGNGRAVPPDSMNYEKADAIPFVASRSTRSRAGQAPHPRAIEILSLGRV